MNQCYLIGVIYLILNTTFTRNTDARRGLQIYDLLVDCRDRLSAASPGELVSVDEIAQAIFGELPLAALVRRAANDL